jgi:predicted O-methyltransferase YrrM
MLDMTVEQRDAIKTALLETYFRPSWQPGVPLSQAFEVDLNAHIETRWRHFSNLIPWLAGHVELSTSRVIEIGSGTGSSTAAIAPHVDFVQCYEINPVSIEAARRRLAILGVKNAEIVQSAFDEASAAKIGTVDGRLSR